MDKKLFKIRKCKLWSVYRPLWKKTIWHTASSWSVFQHNKPLISESKLCKKKLDYSQDGKPCPKRRFAISKILKTTNFRNFSMYEKEVRYFLFLFLLVSVLFSGMTLLHFEPTKIKSLIRRVPLEIISKVKSLTSLLPKPSFCGFIASFLHCWIWLESVMAKISRVLTLFTSKTRSMFS